MTTHELLLRCTLLCCLFAFLPSSGCGGSGSQDPPIGPGPLPSTLKSTASVLGITVSAAADPTHFGEAQYTQILESEFSALEPENAMKFGPIHPRPNTDLQPYDFAAADQLVSFAKQRGMKVRGHTLVWHQQNPEWLTASGLTSSQLSQALQDHITTVMIHFGADVYAWDVVNEAFEDDGAMRSTIWYDQPGIGFASEGTKYIEQAFQWAHETNPNAKLIYNDYSNETINLKSDAIYAMAQDFKQRSVPLHGVGMQMHIDLSFDNAATLQSFTNNIKRLGDLGLEVHITELDVRLPDSTATSLQAQAALYGKLATICAQQPACKLFQVWGVTDKYSWVPGQFPGYGWALLWDANYQKKPAYNSVVQSWK